MITNSVLSGGGIRLRQITSNDCTEQYVEWLNDPEVNQYLETRWVKQDIESITEFVKAQRDNNHSVLFAIIQKENDKHIGNIKIGPINFHHHHADISYFIGEKSEWNKGYASEAIRLICRYGFEELHLHRIEAGAYCTAIGSIRALEKNGFQREAIFREQVFSREGQYLDVYRYALLKDEFCEITEGGKEQ